ncbi:isopenicillin N synthase family dioxygenase [Pelagicoccus albus]|uniref:2-oxoglutarate-dependent ethylene/succinate-forming enzyme n=1 Tax=Pelagicoccus albus TaxID=415222 RepID=A0A7X1B6P8_9BACT|nr:isopenicillin N synthase family oxygenase [Pelagicoccus albus]MBC2606689.1 isopenicillin N synthase family oxygenase [Pelagicoccus albus]
MQKLPIIDFTPFLQEGPEGRQAVANAIVSAAREVGFCYVKNFGMSQDFMDAAFAVSEAFFKNPAKTSTPFKVELNHGYGGLKGEALDPSKPADLKETLTLRDVAKTPSGADYWVNPEFEAFMRCLYASMRRSASTIMQAFAMGLELPVDYFDQRHSGEVQTLRLLHYPPCKFVSEGQLGAGEHTDYGTLTVLFQDNKGGLQVQGLDGEWIDAPPIPGTAVINTGDLMARWSNDTLRSTPHRVIPRPAAMKEGRQSIAFFSDPDSDVLIEPFATCVSEKKPALYPPVTAGDYIMGRIKASQAK